MGRPRKTRDLDDSDDVVIVADEVNPAIPKARSLPWVDFVSFAASYPAPDGVCFYLYRIWPVIDLRLVGVEVKHIDKFTECPGEDEIKRKWGSGEYKLYMTDSHLPGKQDKRVCGTTLEIRDPDFEPAFEYGYREVDLGNKNNHSFVSGLRLRGLLKGADVENDKAAAVAVQEISSIAKEAMAKKKEGAEEDRSIRLFEMAMRLRDQGNGGLSDVMKAQNEFNATLLKMLLNREPQRQNPMDELDRTLKLMERIDGTRRSSGGPGKWDWISDLAQQLAPVLVPLLLSRTAGSVGAAPGPMAPPPPMAPAPFLPEGNGMMNMERVVSIAQRALSAFERGATGDQFAEALVTLEPDGETLYGSLAVMGEQVILQALRSTPQWQALASREAAVTAWVREFLEYGSAEEEAGSPGGSGVAA